MPLVVMKFVGAKYGNKNVKIILVKKCFYVVMKYIGGKSEQRTYPQGIPLLLHIIAYPSCPLVLSVGQKMGKVMLDSTLYISQSRVESAKLNDSQDSKPQISGGDPKFLLTALQETFVTLFQGDLSTTGLQLGSGGRIENDRHQQAVIKQAA